MFNIDIIMASNGSQSGSQLLESRCYAHYSPVITIKTEEC